MEKFTTITIIFAIFLSILTIGNSIHCFQCNSALYPECADLTVNDTKSVFYKPCEGQESGNHSYFCRKYVTTLLHVKDEKESLRIHRSCGWINTEKINGTSCDKEESDFIMKTSCFCFSDGCNSSTSINSSKFTLFLMFIISCIFF